MMSRMETTIHRAFITFAVLFFSLCAIAFVYAQDRDKGDQNTNDDSIVRQDRTEYQKFNFENRFGVHFQSHTRVCNGAQDGEANCDVRVVTDSAGVPMVTSKALPAGLSPAKMLSAYNLTGVATTSKRIIAIVDAYHDPNIQKDLSAYSAMYGIPSLPACTGAITSSGVPCFKQVDQRGGTRFPRIDAGWSLEIALDVEVAHAICQNCSILLVEADSSSFANLMTAVDRAVALGAKVISNSYGAAEFSGETAYDMHFNHPGVAFTVSAGDSGYGVEYPAASRYVTAVGGTSLFLNPDGSYNQELAWSGTGSGCSVFESKQPWQVDAGCAKRMVADVSAVADPNTGAAVYDTVRYAGRSGWFQVGGTSLSSPLIAAVYALSGNTSGAANATPYANPLALNDVANGSNGSCGGTYLCTALTGFDGPTGIGSPHGFVAF